MKLTAINWRSNLRMVFVTNGHHTCPVKAGSTEEEAYRESAKELRRLADECERRSNESRP